MTTKHLEAHPEADAEAIWERYVSAWKVKSVADKRALFEACLSSACIYRDPLMVAEGWDQLAAYMVAFHEQIPGGHFVTEHFQAHHGRSIARWKMMSGDGTELDEGISYGEYDAEGKLVAMTGFFRPQGEAKAH